MPLFSLKDRSVLSPGWRRLHWAVLLGLLLSAAARPGYAQQANTGGNTGGNTGTNTGTNTNGGGAIFGGVFIGPDGKFLERAAKENTGALKRLKGQARTPRDSQSAADVADLRKVSLRRLESAVANLIAQGETPTAEMLNLAGMTRLTYVLVYPAAADGSGGDIVLAGPAEPFGLEIEGRVCGQVTGQPTLQLHDLVLALRTFTSATAEDRATAITCSIDPTPEGLARLQDFLNSLGGKIPADGDLGALRTGLVTSLGKHVVTLGGIAPETHMAHVLVEADYRMKLIGIGLEQPSARIPSYVSLAPASGVAGMQRWWFVPDYKCLRLADDGLAMELVGQTVRLVGEDEVVAQDGNRTATGKQNRASKAFTTAFTKNYAELASASPVYAQLKNVIDVCVAAAYLGQSKALDRAQWNPGVFADSEAFNLEVYPALKEVDAAANVLTKGRRLQTPVGGGVNVDTQSLLQSENQLKDEDGHVAQAREQINLDKLPANHWWWD